MADMTPEELQALYTWVDEVPLSRQKKNISRDFSDGGKTGQTLLPTNWFRSPVNFGPEKF